MNTTISASNTTFRADTHSKISVAVAKKVLDSAEAGGETAIRMISDAAAVGKGSHKSGPQITPASSHGSIASSPGAGETGRHMDIKG